MANGTPFRVRYSTVRGGDVLRGEAATGIGVTADIHGTMVKRSLNGVRRFGSKIAPILSSPRRIK